MANSRNHRLLDRPELDSGAGDRVYNEIVDAIVSRKASPGYPLREEKLAAVFQVSRTIVRSALQRLSIEGLVEITRYVGAKVAAPDPLEARDVFFARKMIESYCIPTVISRITPEDMTALREIVTHETSIQLSEELNRDSISHSIHFHHALIGILNNQSISYYLSQLLARTSLILSLYGTRDSVACSHHDHLLNLISDKEVSSATRWVEEHLDHIENSLVFISDSDGQEDLYEIFSRRLK